MAFFSIIVPTYNSSEYLFDCLMSILQQTFSDFEVIIVDGLSTDNTITIAKKFVNKDCRFKLYSSERGVSRQRNMGISNSNGNFVIFVDSDDIISTDFLMVASKIINMHPKGKSFFFESTKNVKDLFHEEKNYHVTIKKLSSINEYYIDTLKKGFRSVCSKVFSREVFNTLTFDQMLEYGEDADFIFRFFLNYKIYISVNLIVYFYRDNPKSTTHSFDARLLSSLEACKKQCFILKELDSQIYAFEAYFYCLEDVYLKLYPNKKIFKEVKGNLLKHFKILRNNSSKLVNKKLRKIIFLIFPKLCFYIFRIKKFGY